jgi:metal-responsive CopG/Arc/MetJ family transcriptional regulator
MAPTRSSRFVLPRPRGEATVQTITQIPLAHRDAVDRLAVRRNVSRSEIIRTAVAKYLDSNEARS